MSVIRLLIDEDAMESALVRGLRARGVDAETVLDAQLGEQADSEVLAYATRAGRILYTFNQRDFYRLHTEIVQRNQKHTGIIIARQQHYSIGGQLSRLLRLISTYAADEMVNRIEFLSTWSDTDVP